MYPTILVVFVFLLTPASYAYAREASSTETVYQRLIEKTFSSSKRYADPFNDVDVDVIFTHNGRSWRVPCFWRGGSTWTVRFAPPEYGEFHYYLESTDRGNPDLNGQRGGARIMPYAGDVPLLLHGAFVVSKNRRYFEHADGVPFFWLADTWWAGLSSRLSWEGFQTLTADRKTKGFTVVQIVAGLVPSNEELAPSDPGFCNEGGCVWEQSFERINPKFFDSADRRIQYLVDNGIAPAIVGAWRQALEQMGIRKLKQHWRYLIARYGAYPVFWIVGGEVYDPPTEIGSKLPGFTIHGHFHDLRSPGWTDIARYVRATDPYHHPLTVHEIDPPFDFPLRDESLTDFDLVQAGHNGWPSIPTAIASLNLRYSRKSVTKPVIVGEIGYEQIAQEHFADFQRAAFWLSMLNGAAGHTYGAVSTFEAYSSSMPFQRLGKHSFLEWQEGMKLPGSYQLGLSASLLQQYRWWEIKPRPDWVDPAGTTLFNAPDLPNDDPDVDSIRAFIQESPPPDDDLPLGKWHAAHGRWRLPYAAGIPGELRIIYLPYFGFRKPAALRVLGLESNHRYHAYYWEPSLGIRFDLGLVGSSSQEYDRGSDTAFFSRTLHDATGQYRGELRGPGWDDYGKRSRVDGDTFLPENPPTSGDWILVMEGLKH